MTEACRHNVLPLIKYMIHKCIIDPNQVLEYACSYGTLEIVDHVFQLGAMPDVRTFEQAIIFDHLPVIQYFIENNAPCRITTIFGAACKYGRKIIMDYLFTKFELSDGCLDKLLLIACARQELSMVEYLVAHGANPINWEAFLKACAFDKIDIVKYFVNQGVDPKTNEYESLFIACRNNATKVVDYFISQGMNLSILNVQWLEMFASYGYVDMLKLLDNHGISLIPYIYHLFLVACHAGNLNILDFLGATFVSKNNETNENNINDVSIQNLLDEGLIVASSAGHFLVVKFLIEHGANADYNGSLALLCARNNKHYMVTIYLMGQVSKIPYNLEKRFYLSALLNSTKYRCMAANNIHRNCFVDYLCRASLIYCRF